MSALHLQDVHGGSFISVRETVFVVSNEDTSTGGDDLTQGEWSDEYIRR